MATPEVSGRQKRDLRALGQRIDPTVTIGTAGLTTAVIHNTDVALTGRELVKIHVREGSPRERKALASELADALNAAFIGGTGRKLLLYRPNPDLHADTAAEHRSPPAKGTRH